MERAEFVFSKRVGKEGGSDLEETSSEPCIYLGKECSSSRKSQVPEVEGMCGNEVNVGMLPWGRQCDPWDSAGCSWHYGDTCPWQLLKGPWLIY